jgi:hypothetical protein
MMLLFLFFILLFILLDFFIKILILLEIHIDLFLQALAFALITINLDES